MRFIVEFDLLPTSTMVTRHYPVTRRIIITAESIRDALLKVDSEITPGNDCVSVRIHEVDETY